MNRQFQKYRKRKWLLFLIVPIVLVAAGLLVMTLWNAILPEVTGAKPINYWQATGLFILCKILFGNFHGPRRRNDGMRNNQWRDQWMNASDEERAAMKEEWKTRLRRWKDHH